MRLALFALLAVGCGGQVDDLEPAVHCHEVRGYFADQRCAQPLTFDSCAPPEHVFAIEAFKCTMVTP